MVNSTNNNNQNTSVPSTHINQEAENKSKSSRMVLEGGDKTPLSPELIYLQTANINPKNVVFIEPKMAD